MPMKKSRVGRRKLVGAKRRKIGGLLAKSRRRRMVRGLKVAVAKRKYSR